jgi:type I restriction enzyme, S subunit
MNAAVAARPLGELTTLISSGSTPKGGSETYLEQGPVMLIRSQNVRMNRLSLEEVAYITEEIDSGMKRTRLQPGDVLLNITGASIGRVAPFHGECRANVNQHVCVIRPNSTALEQRYLSHLIATPEFQREVDRLQHGGTRQALTFSQIASFAIPVLSLAEQRRIAEVLDRAEALRTNRRAALAQLDTLTQAMFLDLFGDPVSNPKSFPELEMRAAFASKPIFGTMIPPAVDGGEWLSLRVANIQDWKLDLSDRKFVDLPAAARERHSVKDGDMLMARAIASQAHLGKSVIAYPGTEKWAFDSHLMRLRFSDDMIVPEYIRHLLMTPGGRQRFLSASRRSAVQFNINTKEIAAIRIPVPPIDLQRDFLRRVTATETVRVAQRASLAELDALFASLQHRAFRGEL